MRVEVILLARAFVDQDALEDQGIVEIQVDGLRPKDRVDDAVFRHAAALLHESVDGRSAPFPGQACPTAWVTDMSRAVNPFSTATRARNSAA